MSKVKKLFLAFSMMLAATFSAMANPSHLPYVGVNLPDASFTPSSLPGTYGKDYAYPTANIIDKFAILGATVIRISFLWERLQPQLNGPLDKAELARLDHVVAQAGAQGVAVILDPHNYGFYRSRPIGSSSVPIKSFSRFWSLLSRHYKSTQNVIFGLMNEPHQQKPAEWAAIAQSAIDSIRQTGARQLILVPGTRWSGAMTWSEKDGNLSNAEAMKAIVDPDHHFGIEFHQYFDNDYSGTSAKCVSKTIGVEALTGATAWLRKSGDKGFLGEFGASSDPVCLAALKQTLVYIQKNRDVWLGWTYWASSPWFGSYMFNIYPVDPARSPQLRVIMPFFHSSRIVEGPIN